MQELKKIVKEIIDIIPEGDNIDVKLELEYSGQDIWVWFYTKTTAKYKTIGKYTSIKEKEEIYEKIREWTKSKDKGDAENH